MTYHDKTRHGVRDGDPKGQCPCCRTVVPEGPGIHLHVSLSCPWSGSRRFDVTRVDSGLSAVRVYTQDAVGRGGRVCTKFVCSVFFVCTVHPSTSTKNTCTRTGPLRSLKTFKPNPCKHYPLSRCWVSDYRGGASTDRWVVNRRSLSHRSGLIPRHS